MADRKPLSRLESAMLNRPVSAGDPMGCYVLTDDRRRVCTLEFGHDGDHVAHGPGGRVIQTWERKATDRSGSEE